MEKPNVKLLAYTPDPEKVIALAAKLCYSPANISSLEEKISKEDQHKFLEKLVKMGHLSPFEHASFTFGIENISRVLTHQLVRHRIASYSQQSQRYVEFGQDIPYRVPDAIAQDPDAKQKYDEFMKHAAEMYHYLIEKKVPAEDARYLMPHCVDTKIIVTMNARELLQTYFPERLCRRAQHEHRILATEMYKLVLPIAPYIFSRCGPKCITDRCAQGKMSCGLVDKVKEEFDALVGQYQQK
jgi:thymidylate synthase (FAD)